MTKAEFFRVFGNWNSHLKLLWPALEATKHLKLPVLELGSGIGSTAVLRQYCKDERLEFVTYDDKAEYAKENESIHVTDWSNIPWRREWGVVLADHAPGEHRKIALSLLHGSHIIVAHDTEIVGAGDYQMSPEIIKYKYYIDFETPGAWATAMSDIFDVRQLKFD